MLIEITSPALLILGALRLEGKTHLLGVTLQYPPIQLFAQPAMALKVTGARADEARRQAEAFYDHHALEGGAEIEIELAIPNHVGLGSGPMLGLSVAQAISWAHGLSFGHRPLLAQLLDYEPRHASFIYAFDQGGLLLVEAEASPGSFGAIRRRHAIEHPTDSAWAFNFVFPKTPPGTPPTLEEDRLQALLAAAPRLDDEASRKANEQLWDAAGGDDILSFANALMAIQSLNAEASPSLTDEEQSILDVMREGGALAYGRTATGMGLFGLTKGSKPSIELRRKLQNHIGLSGGTVMATIADNAGARHTIKEETLADRSLRDT